MADTIGYSLGMVEGFLEKLIEEGDTAAETVLTHFKAIEQELIQKTNQVFQIKNTLNQMQQSGII